MLPRPRRVFKYLIYSLPLWLFVSVLSSAGQYWSIMPSAPSATDTAKTLLAKHGLRLQNLEAVQSLWAGYGQICRLTATPDVTEIAQDAQSYILKLITPPPTRANDEGHSRKILSYQAEQYFYSHLAPQLPTSVPVAECLDSINQHHADGTSTTAMILSDLKQQYPVAGEKRNMLSSTQVNATLDWLSGFHGFWWSRVKDMNHSLFILPPLEEVQRDGHDASKKTLWLNGGYTYLATRRKEYDSLAEDQDSEWSTVLTVRTGSDDHSIAEVVAAFLTPATSRSAPVSRYQTLIHGDVKSENLFTNDAGDEVAFYDFQYTGLGLGVCDLAKLFTCSVPLEMLVADSNVLDELSMQDGEKALLERYWNNLQDIGQQEYDWEELVFHWEIALVDWLRFQASWGFWGNTEWLEARVRHILSTPGWSTKVRNSLGEAQR